MGIDIRSGGSSTASDRGWEDYDVNRGASLGARDNRTQQRSNADDGRVIGNSAGGGAGARNFFSFGWLLDPGRSDRRAAAARQQDALNMWLDAGRDAPNYRSLTPTVDRNALTYLDRDQDYIAGMDAQRQALAQMQGVANAGGYTDVERGQIRQAQQQAAQHERSQRLAALQAMQSRGMAGGGAELASRLAAQQGGANRAANDAVNIATAGQQRALQAMQDSANMGRNVAKDRRERANAINQFNRANANARVQGVQNAFANRMQTLAGATGQYNTNANSMYQQANQAQENASGIVNTAIGAILS